MNHLLPFEKRIELLHKALAEETPESLKARLESYGPFADIPESCFKYWEHLEGKGVQRRIVSAANRFTDKETGEVIVIASARHYSPLMSKMIKYLETKGVKLSKAHGDNQGFIDQFDDYHTREEALVIAQWADQLHYEKGFPEDQLFSEDLYQ